MSNRLPGTRYGNHRRNLRILRLIPRVKYEFGLFSLWRKQCQLGIFFSQIYSDI